MGAQKHIKQKWYNITLGIRHYGLYDFLFWGCWAIRSRSRIRNWPWCRIILQGGRFSAERWFFAATKFFIHYRQKFDHFWWSGAKCTFGWWDIENLGKFRCPFQSSEGHGYWNFVFTKVTVFRSYKTFLYDILFLGQTHFPICPFHEHKVDI